MGKTGKVNAVSGWCHPGMSDSDWGGGRGRVDDVGAWYLPGMRQVMGEDRNDGWCEMPSSRNESQ